MLDGWVTLIKGMRSSRFVSHCDWAFQFMFKPQMVLFSGSEPFSTFVVSGFSCTRMNVPPIWKFFVKS